MGLAALDSDSSTKGVPEARGGLPEMPVSNPGDMACAVAHLLQDKFLTHTFGIQGEWEVRTTLVTSRQAWRCQCSVFVHGKEAKKDFSPINVDRTRQIRQAEAVTEEVVAAFAREAVEVHFTRCASVAEYSVMASIFSQLPPQHHLTKKVALVLLSVVVLLTAYLWKGSNSMGPEQPEWKPSPHSVRWLPLQEAYHYPAGEPFVFPLPTLERRPEGLPVEVTLEASGDEPSWLELDRERLALRGTAPLTAADQTYRLSVRAHAEPGGDSRLLVVLTITSEPDPPPPPLRRHWRW
jgi:hypothetical protein